MLLVSSTAWGAPQVSWTTPALLKDMFATSEKVSYVEVSRAELGGVGGKEKYVVYVAKTGDKIDGYAVIDDEKGQHEPISFGIKISPEGKVERIEVMVYREAYGSEIKDPRFRAQFVNKTRGDTLKLGQDIDGITGATISARSTTNVVKRALALVEAAKKK
jgi:Na+-translocating ferredoxin:NAD+ oxidoreductase subunit G